MQALSYPAAAQGRRLLRVLLLRDGGLPAHPGARLLPLENSTQAPIAFEMSELQSAAQLVHRVMPPTPLYAWPRFDGPAVCGLKWKHRISLRPVRSRFAAASSTWI